VALGFGAGRSAITEDLMNKLAKIDPIEETADVLATIGRNIRRLRNERGLTLQALADQTQLSASMLSLLERGKTGPSIGTLVVIASALGAQMSDLIDGERAAADDMVSRFADQPVVETAAGVTRRILRHDRARGVEIAINTYKPGTASAPEPVAHDGCEFGVVLDGTLEVTVGGRTHKLQKGDLISYPSTEPHRFSNTSSSPARTMWLNLKRDPMG
jgi:transcriptional regulator with XRE-family HTH domain